MRQSRRLRVCNRRRKNKISSPRRDNFEKAFTTDRRGSRTPLILEIVKRMAWSQKLGKGEEGKAHPQRHGAHRLSKKKSKNGEDQKPVLKKKSRVTPSLQGKGERLLPATGGGGQKSKRAKLQEEENDPP